MTTIRLPKGHKWQDAPAPSSNCYVFKCSRCGGAVLHDMTDDSMEYEPAVHPERCPQGEMPE